MVKVVIMKLGRDSYEARVGEDPKLRAAGQSRYSALGNLVMSLPELFGVNVEVEQCCRCEILGYIDNIEQDAGMHFQIKLDLLREQRAELPRTSHFSHCTDGR